MPTLKVLDGIKIQVFADDHNPPHFHALKGEYEVLIRIGSWNVLRGQMRRKDLDAVIAWANSHEEELRNEWTRLNG
ncbi:MULTISPECIES: DUF4160 domain-containing protein [unclassified Mesorhizobium]|uniref:DUF4160 domain-containing protein n=1 Tax=unclassified Mesorhizobium TaxID=325217 RepID=UPI0011272F23|nr:MULTISPECIES: DUF4160 domain-containing protein [unclassified Mesorhizobium]MBZ9704014.1 DUF4160 domain-containing protein [Mesorhizobium sp. CO1-1-3]MBZ9949506.1 DUF4160 domain-containing protein [Mesorhizobium sp. BR1-1-11]MBZ9980510.1 DUF4160 domain-containing protein [Mesorhizobium sp. BR-1-1-8]TPI97124.1 DUF4160 domain-containing protein [Mesorhizobium sp. B2-8-1]TPK56436.1 DUF4160 domain-containing protein [Mesorhizobium sp. B2-5-2]